MMTPATNVFATVTTILERMPSLEMLTLFFLPEPEDLAESEYLDADEEELAMASLRAGPLFLRFSPLLLLSLQSLPLPHLPT